jgi:hypothetical protein
MADPLPGKASHSSVFKEFLHTHIRQEDMGKSSLAILIGPFSFQGVDQAFPEAQNMRQRSTG